MRFASIAVSVALGVGSAVFPLLAAEGSPPTLQDDAYHFPEFEDGAHDSSYAEWWYFNLIDPAEELRFVVGYAIFGPSSAVGRSAVTAVAYTEEETISVTESFPTNAFSASTEVPDVNVGGINSMQVVAPETFHVAGSLDGEHSISWSLVYVPRVAPWQGSDEERVGLLPWERMSWLNYLPGATVQGWVTIDGRTRQLGSATGYHDHNWGEWIPAEVVWDWAQYHEEGFSLALGSFRNWPTGVVGVDVDGERVEFEFGQYLLRHKEWEIAETGQSVPVRSRLVAFNGQFALFVDMKVERTAALLPPPELPLPILKPVIYEQTATFTGLLWAKSEGGAWTVARWFHGPGFKEYTGRVRAGGD